MAKVISSLHQNCDWLLHNFDTRRTGQNGEIVKERIWINPFTSKILKLGFWIQIRTLIWTMSASSQFERNLVLLKEFKTALEKKLLDRKSNRQGLMKAKTQPRSARPPLWRDKLRIEGESVDADEKNTDGNKGVDEVFARGESMLWLAPGTWSTRLQSKKG